MAHPDDFVHHLRLGDVYQIAAHFRKNREDLDRIVSDYRAFADASAADRPRLRQVLVGHALRIGCLPLDLDLVARIASRRLIEGKDPLAWAENPD